MRYVGSATFLSSRICNNFESVVYYSMWNQMKLEKCGNGKTEKFKFYDFKRNNLGFVCFASAVTADIELRIFKFGKITVKDIVAVASPWVGDQTIMLVKVIKYRYLWSNITHNQTTDDRNEGIARKRRPELNIKVDEENTAQNSPKSQQWECGLKKNEIDGFSYFFIRRFLSLIAQPDRKSHVYYR